MRAKRIALLVAVFALFACAGSAARAEGPNAVITSVNCQATELPANDDFSTSLVTLPFTVNFFGTSYSSLYVNNNGNVTFDSSQMTYTPYELLTTHRVIIAPFFGDVDTRTGATTHYGTISAGTAEVGGHQAFCVNWVNVGYFSQHTDKLNSFQLLLVDRSDTGAGNFDIYFNYDKVQWETGDASSGLGGLGGSSARVGYSNGSTASYELAGSGVPGSFLDSNPGGLIHDNIGAPLQNGRYIFPVRNGAATGHSVSGHVWANAEGNPLDGAFLQACPTPFDTACRVATSAPDGSFEFDNLPDHTSGGGAVDHDWTLTVNPPSGSTLSSDVFGPFTVGGSDVTGRSLVLTGPAAIPAGTSVTSGGTTSTSGTPSVYWGDPITVSTSGCAGGTGTATMTVADGYSSTVDLTESPAGTYTATFPAPDPHHGNASFSWTISCGTSGGFDVYIDPSGVVKTLGGAPIAGATVTLFRSDDPGGPFVQVPNGSAIMSPSNRANPDTTTAAGEFGWDVVAGYYKVQAAKTGCSTAETDVMTIPPPVTNLDLRLDCGGDTTPPETSIDDHPATLTNETTAAFAFSANEAATFECTVDDGASYTCTSTETLTGLAEGEHSFEVAATDTAGNTDATPATFAWTIDLTPPDTTLLSHPPNPSKLTTAAFTFSSPDTGATFTCTLDGVAAGCTSPATYSGLTARSHLFQVAAVDAAGNVDPAPAEFRWTNGKPPKASITAGPRALVPTGTAVFSFTSTDPGATFECSLDSPKAYAACTSPKTYDSLLQGKHTFYLRAYDALRRVGTASSKWGIDFTIPETTITKHPLAVTTSRTASFVWKSSEPGSTFQCWLDRVATPCKTSLNLKNLAGGDHYFEVVATDPAGNPDPTPAGWAWKVDLS